jgi:hypothetical protein
MDTLWTALEALPDRRTKKGRRYKLESVVMVSLSGANDLRAIFRWGRRLTPNSLAMLGIDRRRVSLQTELQEAFRPRAHKRLTPNP